MLGPYHSNSPQIDVAIPDWMINADETDRRPIRTTEKAIAFNKVRLVYALRDEETGVTRDVIVKEITRGRVFRDKSGEASWTRYIPYMDVSIPWPEKQEPEYTEHPGDTARLDVETKTLMPSLLTPPMPGSVINELRNKYSVFRTRHDADYIAAKQAEDAETAQKQRLSREMRTTPLKEIHIRERKANKAKGNKQMSEDMKIKIGRLIAEKQEMMMKAGGMSTSQSLGA